MGLDMYLNASVTFSEYDAAIVTDPVIKDGIRQSLDILGSLPTLPSGFKNQKFFTVEVTLAQWRKSNQIHKWFVDNLQDGRDECQKTYVSRDNIRTLIDLCKQVLADPDNARILLPTGSGFFFGSTEYDDYYFQDLRQTIDMLTPLLEEEYKQCFFSYSSSW